MAVVSPSFAAPGRWPAVYQLGLKRVREVFDLDPVEFPATKKLGASGEERAKDLVAAFEDHEIKAVVASLGGDDQVTYIKNLPTAPFIRNLKPFFGFSDNSHFCNWLFLNDIPSFYGASLFTQFAAPGEMDAYTISYLKHALFESGEFELLPAEAFTDSNEDEKGGVVDWNNPDSLGTKRRAETNEGWFWDGTANAEGLLWGGCLESIDEMLRHDTRIPTLEQFNNIILMLETSEEIPHASYVRRVIRALGERGILGRVQGILVGRPKAWEFDKPNPATARATYREQQRAIVLDTVRRYNTEIPIVQNLDFGHTNPQVPMPYGGKVRIQTDTRQIFAVF